MIIYRRAVTAAFLVVLTGTLFLGRGFSVLKLFEFSGWPFYVTDVFIIFAFPLSMAGMWSLLRLPQAFRIPFFSLFFMGCLYLGRGLFAEHSTFAARGVVLSIYLLFLPLVWRMCLPLGNMAWFFIFVIFYSALSFLFFWNFGWSGLATFLHIDEILKPFNFALYSGMSLAFLLAYGREYEGWAGKALILLFSALNLLLVVSYGVRSAWVALACLSVFFLILLRSHWKYILISYSLIIIVVIGALQWQGYKPNSFLGRAYLSARFYETKSFIFQMFTSKATAIKKSPEGVLVAPKGLIAPLERNSSQKLVENASPVIEKGTLPSVNDVSNKSLEAGLSVPKEIAASFGGSISQKSAGNVPPMLEDGAAPLGNSILQVIPGQTPAPSIQDEAVGTITWRFKLWTETYRVGMSSPVWGSGFAKVLKYSYGITGLPISGFAKDSGIMPVHNELLTVFFKMGLIGLALFLWLNGFIFVQGVRAVFLCEPGLHRAALTGALGSFVVWHVMAQFIDLIDSPPTNIFLWMLLGFILALVYSKKSQLKQYS